MVPSRGLALNDVAERLGVHYMTVYGYVRTGRLPAEKEGGEWRVKPADLRAFERAASGRKKVGGRAGRRLRRAEASARLEGRLLAGDEAGAWTIAEEVMSAGATPADIHLDLLIPALQSIGEKWAHGEIDVADEHVASAIASRVVGRLGPRFARRGRRRGVVVLGAPAGQRHGLATAILADLLRGESFDVVDLGPDVPAKSFVLAVRGLPGVDAIGISVATDDGRRELVKLVKELRQSGYTGRIVVGGAGVADSTGSPPAGVTEVVPEMRAALEVFRSIYP
ncbi:MAG: B12-binding domain-containing protein [Acidimicrobiia bacterium]